MGDMDLTPAELDSLNRLSGKQLAVITNKVSGIFVGSFTHKNERLGYVYVRDATGLESALHDFYKTECPGRRP